MTLVTRSSFNGKDELQSGEKMIFNLGAWLDDDFNQKLLSKFKNVLNIEPIIISNKNLPLSGIKVVLTGKLSKYSREEIKEKFISMGAIISSSVSSRTDFVIAGENAGSKLKKAIELNVKIYDENEYESIIKNPSKYT